MEFQGITQVRAKGQPNWVEVESTVAPNRAVLVGAAAESIKQYMHNRHSTVEDDYRLIIVDDIVKFATEQIVPFVVTAVTVTKPGTKKKTKTRSY